ncbi:FG-GAP repeat protein [Vibrio sp. VNB-15]
MKALTPLIACTVLLLPACKDTQTGTELITTPPQQQEVDIPKVPNVEPKPEPLQPPETESPILPPVDNTPVLPPESKPLPDSEQDKQPETPISTPEPTPLPTPPEAFTLASPTSVIGKTFLFQWKPSQHADSYKLCLKSATSKDECRVLSSNVNSTSKQINLNELLTSNATFFVVATNKDGSEKSNEVSIEPSVLLKSIGFLKASNSDSGDNFGHAVAVSDDGSTVAIGAIKESGTANDLTSNKVALSGAVYVYQKSGNDWNQAAYLKASNADAGDEFGYALALSGDGKTLAVGAIQEASSTKGIDGNQLDNSSAASGAVYVYVNDGSSWKQQSYIKSSNSDFIDAFGFSIALSSDGSTMLVGAPGEGSAAQTINGTQSDNTGSLSGAAYLFERQNNLWTQTDYLKASNTDKQDSFGYDVALSANGLLAIVGAPGEDSNTSQINGDQTDNSHSNSGAVYVFSNNGTTWSQESYLKAINNDKEDQFGYSVSTNLDGTVIAVGAFKEASDSETNGNDADNSALASGAAYVYHKEQSQWVNKAYIKAANSDASDQFGTDVQLSNDGHTLAVGAPHESSSSVGFYGDLQLNDAMSAGAAYLYTNTGGVWSQSEYIKSPNTNAGDEFGHAIALSGNSNTLVIGAEKEASSFSGNTTSPDDNNNSDSGAAYIY